MIHRVYHLLSIILKLGEGHPRYTAVVLGVLLGCPFVFACLWPLAYVAIILTFVIYSKVDISELIVSLPILVLAKMLIVLSWYFGTYPLDWIGDLSPSTQIISIILYWFTSALWLSSAGLVGALVIGYYRRGKIKLPVVLLPFGVGALVVFSEYLGSVIFSIFTIGKGAYISGSFSFGYTGYLFSWLYPLASYGGVYMVGWFGLVFLLSLTLYSHYGYKRLLLLLISLTGLYGLSYYNLSYQGIETKLVLVETNFSKLNGTQLDLVSPRGFALEELVSNALTSNPDYVLLPEDSRYLHDVYQADVVGIENAINAWSIIHPTSTTVVVDSGRTVLNSGSVVQRAYVFSNKDTNKYFVADKKYLVPQGEYMPSLYAFFMRLSGLSFVADALSSSINYESGQAEMNDKVPVDIPNILFCFESVSPKGARELVRSRPDTFIVHPISHAWFNNKTVIESQLDTMLRFQAVWSRVPIVGVGNEAKSMIYTPNGKLITPVTTATFPYGEVREVTIFRPDPNE